MIKRQPIKNQIMKISSALAAIFLIKSLRQENLISSITSTLYNIKPFTLEAVSTRILLEDSRQELNTIDTSYYALNTQSQPCCNKHTTCGKPVDKGAPSLPNQPHSVAPTRNNPQLCSQPTSLAAQIERLDWELKQLR